MTDALALSDPDIFPSDEVLTAHLGQARIAFDALFQYNHEHFPDLEARWKYYRDGKSWLMNVSKKKKTVFWLSVTEGAFRTTFYLSRKASELVEASRLSEAMKARFREQAGKRLIGMTVALAKKKDIEEYKWLLRIKLDALSMK